MKLSPCAVAVWSVLVAPRTGAWIETTTAQLAALHNLVAPRTGAWIETNMISVLLVSRTSRPPHGGVD